MSEPPEEGGYRGLPLLVAEDGAVQADYHFAKVQFVAEVLLFLLRFGTG